MLRTTLSTCVSEPVASAVLVSAPPGTGKSMLAQRLPGLLPPLSEDEALEVAALASLAGRFSALAWGLSLIPI